MGPTLPDLQYRTNASSLSSVVTVISANSFGTIIGVAFGGSCYSCMNAFCVMGVVLLGCAGATLVIPWCSTLTGVTLICLVQGITLGFLERGGYSMFYAYWRRRYHVFHMFYLALALGACVSPIVTTPFVFSRLPFSNQNGTISMTYFHAIKHNTGQSKYPSADFGQSSLGHRHKRQEIHGETPPILVQTWKPSVASGSTTSSTLSDAANASASGGGLDGNNTVPTTAAVIKKPVAAKNTNQGEAQPKTDEKAKKIEEAKQKVENEKEKVGQQTVQTLFTQDNQVNVSTQIYSGTTLGSTPPSTTLSPTTTTTTTTMVTKLTTVTPKRGTSSPTDLTTHPNMHSSIDGEKSNSVLLSTTTTSTVVPGVGVGLVSETRILIWDAVLSRVSEINRVHFAYLVISLISMASTAGFAIMLCCMPCTSFRLPPENTKDYRFTPRSLCASRQNLYCFLLTMGMGFLVMGMESLMYNLLTVYVIQAHHRDQAKGVLLTSLYWLCVAVSRIVIAVFFRLVNARLTILSCLGSTLLITAVLTVFSYSWTTVWLGIAILGLSLGPIFPLVYCYLDHSLGYSPWMGSVWLVAAHLGRMVVPVVTVAAMEGRGTPRVALFSHLVCALFACVLFIFLQRTVKAASAMMAVNDFTRQIRQANGDFAEYRRMPNDAEDPMEMDKLDDFLFERDTPRRTAEDGDGVFGKYSNGVIK